MKTLMGLTAAAVVAFMASCTSQQNLSSSGGMSDDGIYNADNTAPSQPVAPSNNGAYTQAPQPAQNIPAPAEADSNNYSANDNYYSDDYNDYGYSSRIRRYDDNWGDWGYYDDVYTNSYWYSYNPYQFGMSIYMGYPWWGPSAYWYSFYPSYYWGFGLGFDYGFGWGYPYWGGFYPGWGGYRWGCRGGYYYNSYEGSSFFAPRTVSSSGTAFRTGPGITGVVSASSGKASPAVGPGARSFESPGSFGEMYQNAVRSEASTHPESFTTSHNGSVHVAPPVASSMHPSSISSLRPSASFRGTNSSMNPAVRSAATARPNTASYSTGTRSVTQSYNSASRSTTSARPNYNNYSRSSSSRSSSRVAPSQGGRSNGSYNYHTSNSGRSSYGGGRSYNSGNHSFGGGGSRSSGGGSHSFGGGGGGGHSSGGGGGHSGGGGGHR